MRGKAGCGARGSFTDEVYVVLRSLRDAAFGYAIPEYGEHDADLLTVAKSAMELRDLLPGMADDNLAAQLRTIARCESGRLPWEIIHGRVGDGRDVYDYRWAARI